MTPLDLSAAPPRSPRETLAGLMMLPRTIDKARALLDGGNPGAYFIGPGVSAWLLGKLGLTQDEFVEIVRDADDEAGVVRAIDPERMEASRCARLNAFLEAMTVTDVSADMQETFARLYGSDLPPGMRVIDVIVNDDRAAFAGHS